MGSVSGLGTPGAAFVPSGDGDQAFRAALAEVLADHDDAVLGAYLDDQAAMPRDWLLGKLAGQVRDALVHPVYFGSAITGAGVGDAHARPRRPAAGGGRRRRRAGLGPCLQDRARAARATRIAYARMFSGTITIRDRVRFGGGAKAAAATARSPRSASSPTAPPNAATR